MCLSSWSVALCSSCSSIVGHPRGDTERPCAKHLSRTQAGRTIRGVSYQPLTLSRTAATNTSLSRPLMLRALLIAGCAVSIGIAMRVGDPAGYLQADADLARVLRGMALIKAALVLGAVLAVGWRFGWRITVPISWGYLVGSWVLAGSTMLVWRLTLIPLAGVLFHVALIGMLLSAWRDDNKRRDDGAALQS